MRNLAGIEQRAAGRFLQVTQVRVPEQAGILRADGLAVLEYVGDHEQLGEAGTAAILAHVDLELAKAAAERDVLLGRELLVAEIHDFVFVEQLDDLAEDGVVEVFRKVDTENFDAERGFGALDIEHDVLTESGNAGLGPAK